MIDRGVFSFIFNFLLGGIAHFSLHEKFAYIYYRSLRMVFRYTILRSLSVTRQQEQLLSRSFTIVSTPFLYHSNIYRSSLWSSLHIFSCLQSVDTLYRSLLYLFIPYKLRFDWYNNSLSFGLKSSLTFLPSVGFSRIFDTPSGSFVRKPYSLLKLTIIILVYLVVKERSD